jgi:hypothetical protein
MKLPTTGPLITTALLLGAQSVRAIDLNIDDAGITPKPLAKNFQANINSK